MFAIEPPSSQYDLNFVVAGVPVRVSPWFWAITVIMAVQGQDKSPATVLIWVSAVFVSILVHELGHVLAFRYYGTNGHVVLYSFGGLAIPNSNAARDRWAQTVISFAGPAAGFLLGALVLAILTAWGKPWEFDARAPVGEWFTVFAFDPINVARLAIAMLYINIFWGLVNLLPIYPLDGGKIAQAHLTYVNPRDGLRQSLMLSMAAAIGMAVFGLIKLESTFAAFFFGYLAFTNYQMLQATRGGGFDGRDW